MLRGNECRSRKQVFFLMELFPLGNSGFDPHSHRDTETRSGKEWRCVHPCDLPCPSTADILFYQHDQLMCGSELLLHCTRSRSKAQHRERSWWGKPPAGWGEEMMIQNLASCPGQYQTSGEALMLSRTSRDALIPKSPKLQGYFRPKTCHFTRMGCYLWGWDNHEWCITEKKHGDIHMYSPVCCATQQDACDRTPPCQGSWNSPLQSWQKDTVNSSGWIHDSYTDT